MGPLRGHPGSAPTRSCRGIATPRRRGGAPKTAAGSAAPPPLGGLFRRLAPYLEDVLQARVDEDTGEAHAGTGDELAAEVQSNHEVVEMGVKLGGQ